MNEAQNPLRKYFRQPAIYLRLPSQGKNYPPSALILPPNNELPVLPMTALDEITARTPDALFNGSAVADIISSCVPNIRDPWCIPSTDLNAILVAIRIASQGHMMDIDSTCPSCSDVSTFQIDLRSVLEVLTAGNYDIPLQVGDMEIYFVPQTYQQINEQSRERFGDEKLLASINDQNISEEKRLEIISEAIKRVTALSFRVIIDSISAIKTQDTMVTEREFIDEYVRNCPKQTFEQIRDYSVKLRESSETRPVALTCASCQHQYQQAFTLDLSNFFVNAS